MRVLIAGGGTGGLIRPAEPRDAEALARLIGQLDYQVTPAEAAERLALMAAEGRLAVRLAVSVVAFASSYEGGR